jgi:hypothetical protein
VQGPRPAAPPIALTQIGRDGLVLPKPASGADWPFAPDYIFMSPGYRVEALLDGGQLAHGDTLCLLSGRFLQEDTTGTADPGRHHQAADAGGDPQGGIQWRPGGDRQRHERAGPPTETQMPDLAVSGQRVPDHDAQGGTVDALARCEEVRGDQRAERDRSAQPRCG